VDIRKELAGRAVETARLRGASYADARVVELRRRDVTTKNGKVGTLDEGETLGLGVRTIAQGAWGFASTDDVSSEGVERCAARAVEIARSSASVRRGRVALAPEPPHVDTWQGPFLKDPFHIPLDRQVELLLEADREMRYAKGVTLAEGGLSFRRQEQIFVSSEGSSIHQSRMQTGAGIVATCFSGGDIQKRSYPNSFGGQHALGGYELAEAMNLQAHAQRVGEESVALHSAAQCPEGTRTILLDGSQLGLQIHESIGHPIELDRVLGSEANYAGISFLTLDKLRKLKYGSEIVNVVADARLEHGAGLGTFGYDDEGVPAQCTAIVTNGLFASYLSSRETATEIGESRSNGTMRADGWNRLPLIRMTNVSLLPGEWKPDDLIADTDDGIYMETNRSWSIDDRRYHFQFSTEIGWEIRGGKKVRMIKNPSYSGITTEFWASCDAICGRDYWTLWGTPNCGKGQPPQTMGTGHGAAPARFRSVRVGVAFSK
jgi:TldD protein